MVRAKFYVESKTQFRDGYRIKMNPVVSGSAENASFFKYTPSGNLEIGTINPEAAAGLEVGQEYYLDISPALAAPAP